MTQEFVTLPREVVEQAQMWIPLLAEIAGLDPETTAAEFSEFADGRPASEFTIAGVITALRAALDHPQGEPVAWISPSALEWSTRESEKVVKLTRKAQPEYDFTEPLYTHPQPAQKPLTDEEILKAVRHLYHSDLPVGMGFSDDLDVARAIEAAHNIK